MGNRFKKYLSNLVPDWRLFFRSADFAKAKPSFFFMGFSFSPTLFL